MPVSLKMADAQKSFGVTAGRYRIVSAEWLIHQFTNKEGKTFDPFGCLAIGYQPVNPEGKPDGDVEIVYDLQYGPKMGEGIDTLKFAPAQEAGKPLPLRVGSKGGYLEPVGSTASLSENSKPLRWLNELYKCLPGENGPEERLAKANYNIGMLVGLEGDVAEMTFENGGGFKATTLTVFKKVHVWPWERTGTQAAMAATTAGTSVDASEEANENALRIAEQIKEDCNKNGTAKMTIDAFMKQVLPVTATKIKPRITPDQREAAKKVLQTPEFWGTYGIGELQGNEITWAA